MEQWEGAWIGLNWRRIDTYERGHSPRCNLYYSQSVYWLLHEAGGSKTNNIVSRLRAGLLSRSSRCGNRLDKRGKWHRQQLQETRSADTTFQQPSHSRHKLVAVPISNRGYMRHYQCLRVSTDHHTVNLLSPWGRVLEKIIVPRLVNKSPALYETWRFLTVFTKPATCPCP
jgi:hypothetical protein